MIAPLQEVSRLYELSWRPSADEGEKKLPPAIVVRIPQSVARDLSGISANAPIVENAAEDFDLDLDSFEGKITQPFGFEQSLRCVRQDNFVEFVGELPASQLGDCSWCNGAGKSLATGEHCSYCEGDGKALQVSTEAAYLLTANLHLLLWYINATNPASRSPRKQLMRVKFVFGRNSSGRLQCSVGGAYSCKLVTGLTRELDLGPITTAMRNAYRFMFQVRNYDKHGFQTDLRSETGWLSISCPGDRCGLFPHSRYRNRKHPSSYEFLPHNVDTVLQTLTLLSGLAALHGQVEEEILAYAN